MKWISVKDRLPDPYVPVLCYIDPESLRDHDKKYRPCKTSYRYDSNEGYRALYPEREDSKDINMTWDTYDKITHWMPLPEKPQ